MELQTFFDNFEVMAQAPSGVQKLREMVLQLAVHGKLTERVESEGDGHQILNVLKKTPFMQLGKKKRLSHVPIEPMVAWNVPPYWAFTTLENTTRGEGVFTDGDWVETKDQDPDGEVRLIQLADVGEGSYRDRSERYMNKETAARLNCTFLKNGDVLLARMPDPLGRACIFPGDLKPSVTVVDVCIVRPNSNCFDNSFLTIAINSSAFRRFVLEKATGTTRSRISRGNLAKFPIPIPPFQEQKRIVAKVDELMAMCDDLEARKQKTRQTCIQLNDACIDKMLTAREPARFSKHWGRIHTNFDLLYSQPENVQKLRQAILQLAVQGKLVPQDPNDEPASVLLEKIRAARQRHFKGKPARSRRALASIHQGHLPSRMPQSWAFERFGNIAMVSGGLTLGRKLIGRETGVFPYLRVANVQRWHIDLTNVKEVEAPLDELEKYRLIKGDILITEGGDWDKVGRSAIWEGEIENCLHQNHIFKARLLNGTLNNQWVIMFLNSPTGRTYFADASKQTTNLASINMTQLRNCIIPIPPIIEQKRIVAKVDELMALCDDLEASLHQSQTENGKLMEAAVAKLLAA